jgi:PadR family transcriptional regulator AphA
MSLENAILGFLGREPVTGYDLKTRCFDRDVAPFWTADQAQIYRTLDRLERSGLVRSEIVPQPGRPDRRVFDLTTTGRRALREWLETPHPIPALRESFLLQIHFSDQLPGEAALAVLETARDGYQRRLDTLRGQSADVGGATTEGARRAARRTALHGAIAATRATIDWIDDCVDRVRERNRTSGPMRG